MRDVRRWVVRFRHGRLADVRHGGRLCSHVDGRERPGHAATASQHITLNNPPVASFTSTCNALTCTYNASGSSDLDGTIVNYAWNFAMRQPAQVRRSPTRTSWGELRGDVAGHR